VERSGRYVASGKGGAGRFAGTMVDEMFVKAGVVMATVIIAMLPWVVPQGGETCRTFPVVPG